MTGPKRSTLRLGLLAMAAAASLALAGCGSSSGGSGASASTTASTSAGPVTLTVWHYFNVPSQTKFMDDFATTFQKSHPNVTVKNVYVPYDLFSSKLIAAAGAQTGPDVVVFNGGEASTIASAGTLAPMTQDWSSFSDASQFPDGAIHKLNNDIVMVQGYVNLLGLWYNQDILDKIGVKPPTTIDELNADMKAAKAAGFKGITLSGLSNGNGEWQAYPWVTSTGFTYQNLDQAALTKGYALVKGWVDAGYLSPEAATWDQSVPFQKWAAGGIAFAENGNWQTSVAKSTAKFKYGVVQLPVGSSGQVYLGGEAEGIGKFSAHPDVAWQYLSETFFSKDGELETATSSGAIPSRQDAAADPAVTGDPLLAGFAATIAHNGGAYPPANAKPDKVTDLQNAGGQAFSSVISGQASPSDAAAKFVAALPAWVNN